ncbi:hypothetical protein EUZ85_02945 [Hahella sp. KA22]|uniref:hypothetical protein n=1 Tax=Hahella sp. KA22 TaxID=1628392 RepID=UPI000FDE0F74|nr:hypothetical protein [Hahella sp. KA22]AZZ89718.1 hypothetical protein ENC22_00400 [Hahella sp. KA22]QAY53088.1 hypothetical protein EUZ85_02945 [Hahella sp. KA22]
MAKCEVKAGFFVLRPCEALAALQCSICERPMCALHTMPVEGEMLCTECGAVQGESDTGDDEMYMGDGGNSTRWFYYYRQHYYTETGDADMLTEDHGFGADEAAAFVGADMLDMQDDLGGDDDSADLFDS